ncbi:MAG: hypothetical protein LBD51_09795 [Bifidobacteriaceae bacterium]|jgi:phosphomannomutase|nr:hypothetical protein [Bifidobacteriaceae bacterium]
MRSLKPILKSNDLRGAVPGQWGPEEAWALGRALARALDGAPALLVGHDMRLSGPKLAAALTAGAAAEGRDVIQLGEVSTDTMYYASGSMALPGAMLTASHNPAGDNGLKLMRPGARPVGRENGLGEIIAAAERLGPPEGGAWQAPAGPGQAGPGRITQKAILPDFAAFLRRAVDLTQIRPLRVAIDAGNGMGGVVADAALGRAAGLEGLPVDIVRLYFEPDGTFPNHPPNPLEPRNLEDLRQAVVACGADLGLAFDGDADRCFAVDEHGQPVAPSVVGVIIALREVARERAQGRPGVVVRNAITSQALPELLGAAGARTVRTRVGHAVVKPAMAELDAVFGAEHSGHFYFRDFFYADSGILTAMHLLAALGSQGLAMSQLAEIHTPYAASGEVNFKVADPAHSIQKVQAAYADDAAAGRVALDSLDGLTVSHWSQAPKWWANVRPSNTEALLRLNVEAEDRDVMVKVRDGIAGLVAEPGAVPG